MVICRGGIVVGAWNDVRAYGDGKSAAGRGVALPLGRTRWTAVFACVIALALALAFLPGRSGIPPLIESDYCYLLLAADRLHDGLGLTSLQPVAPNQPWEWRYDWGFLTQWPVGYPLLLAGLRWLLGCSAVEAARIVGVLGCAGALVGWFVLIRRCVPPGILGILIAALACTSCLSVGALINPSTDLILIATLPFLVLLVTDAQNATCPSRQATIQLAAAGFASGGLFWIRYAGIFVPVALFAVLCVEYVRKRALLRSVGLFAACAALPIVVLIAVNSAWGQADSTTQRFNLGSTIALNLDPRAVGRAWWMYTDLGYYSHRPIVHWLFAALPLALPFVLFLQPVREAFRLVMQRLEVRIVLAAAIALLGMIVAAAALFGSKFDYIGLERYYLPGRPVLVLLFFSPFVLVPVRIIRMGAGGVILMFGWFALAHNWLPTYQRWVASDRPQTPSGAWSRIFEPGAADLYQWLAEQDQQKELLVFSNFHEYLALETGIAALPVPDSDGVMEKTCDRARYIRGVRDPLPVFVLNPKNLWRDYWIKPPQQVIEELDLEPWSTAPAELRPYVFVRRQAVGRRPSTDEHVVELNFAGLRIDGGHGLGVGAE